MAKNGWCRAVTLEITDLPMCTASSGNRIGFGELHGEQESREDKSHGKRVPKEQRNGEEWSKDIKVDEQTSVNLLRSSVVKRVVPNSHRKRDRVDRFGAQV